MSILMVLLGHGCQTIPNGHVLRIAAFVAEFADAHTGVSIFFVISGYLITSILIREHSRTGRIDLRAFYVRRAFRILPPLYACILLVVVLGVIGVISLRASDVLAAMFFVWNYLGGEQWFLGHTWSLSIEEQFYLLWPVVLAWAGKRRAAWMAVGIIAILPVVRVLNYLFIPTLRGRIPIMGHTRADMMMFGCLIALLADEPAFHRWLMRLEQWRGHIAAAIVLFLLEPLIRERLHGIWLLPVGYTLDGVCIAIILAHCIRYPTRGLARVLNQPAVAYIGVISYSLYLWNPMFLTNRNTTWTGIFPLNFGCTFAAAILSFYLVERPALRIRTWLTHDRRPAGPGI